MNMKKQVRFTMSETMLPALPGLEIEVRYSATAEIEMVDEVEVSFEFSGLHSSIGADPWVSQQIPTEEQGGDARKFLGRLREAARRELYRQENPPPTMQEMFRPGKPDPGFIE